MISCISPRAFHPVIVRNSLLSPRCRTVRKCNRFVKIVKQFCTFFSVRDMEPLRKTLPSRAQIYSELFLLTNLPKFFIVSYDNEFIMLRFFKWQNDINSVHFPHNLQ